MGVGTVGRSSKPSSRKAWHLPPTLALETLSRNAWAKSSGKASLGPGQTPHCGEGEEPKDMGSR